MIESWQDRAKARMKELGLKQEDLTDALGVSQTAVSYYLSGKREPTLKQFTALSEKLGRQIQWLLKGEAESRQIPLISFLEAGNLRSKSSFSILKEDNRKFTSVGMNQISFIGKNAFAIEVKDESMTPDYNPRDYVIVDPDADPTPGDIVIAKLSNDSEAILRKYKDEGKNPKGNELFSLEPLNTYYPSADKLIKGKSANIIGKVIGIQRYYVGSVTIRFN